MSPQNSSIARSTLWNQTGKLTDYVAVYCSSDRSARGLGVDLNGALAGMMSGVTLVLAFSSVGLAVALTRVISQPGEGDVGPRARAIVLRPLKSADTNAFAGFSERVN